MADHHEHTSDLGSDRVCSWRRVSVLCMAVVGSVALSTSAARAEPFSSYEKFDGFSFVTGESFYRLCTSKDDISQQSCQAFVCGAFDAWTAAWIGTKTRPAYTICLKRGTTCGQLATAVTNYLTEHPDERIAAAAGAVGYSLSRTFPCDRPG